MIGVKLFVRTKRGTFATENGKAFLTVAERIVTDIYNLLTTAKNVSYGEQGRLAIGFSSSLMTGNLRFAIGDYIGRSEEHTSELQSLMRISYAVFCLKKKN